MAVPRKSDIIGTLDIFGTVAIPGTLPFHRTLAIPGTLPLNSRIIALFPNVICCNVHENTNIINLCPISKLR